MSNLPLVIDSFDHYMARISQFEPLDRETEYELAQRYRQHNDLDAAHKLVCANLRFVVKIAYEYQAYGLKMIDLVQEGNIGLMKAIKKFDPDRNIRLISYAVWWIRAYIHNYIINGWSLVKIGTTQAQKKLFFKLKQTREALKKLGADPDHEAIADQLNVTEAEVDEMSLRLGGRDSSLDCEIAPDSTTSHLDNLVAEHDNQEQYLIKREDENLTRRHIRSALNQLNEREQHIVRSRILDEDKTTLQDLAEQYGISKERVRQLEKRALEKLKDALIAQGIDEG
ncbi:MAG: RNA polymerase sigma factor RpoH [Desulfuromonas sp.]|jgi:RNA polymerase sigma-32 factor|nr:MAG: RNA polymerase sigma factor RpoH [Desulfuromonas sp.]